MSPWCPPCTHGRRDEYGKPQLDQLSQERQAGAAQGQCLVQVQIATGGDFFGHRVQSGDAQLSPQKAVRRRLTLKRNAPLCGVARARRAISSGAVVMLTHYILIDRSVHLEHLFAAVLGIADQFRTPRVYYQVEIL